MRQRAGPGTPVLLHDRLGGRHRGAGGGDSAPAKLQLIGMSSRIGTYVAVQYARQFPASTEGLILDSVVGPDGIDPYFLDTFGRLPRVLAEQCASGRCRTATDDPVADLGTLTRKLAQAPLRGRIPGSPWCAVRDGDPRRVRAAVDHHVGRSQPVPAGGATGGDRRGGRRRRGTPAAAAAHRAGAVGARERVERGAQRRHDLRRRAAALHLAHALSRSLDAVAPRRRRRTRQRVRAV